MPKKKKELLISFILDETGSMMSCQDQTISGFNEYIKTLKDGKDSSKIRFTLTQFNSEKIDVVYEGVSLKNVEDRSNDNYAPNHITPLYDAIGATIRSLEKKKNNDSIVVIQTDGAENASKDFTREGIFKLIDEKKKSGWTFVFMGADQDAYLASASMGIPKGNTMSYDSSKTLRAFTVTAEAVGGRAEGSYLPTSNLYEEYDESEVD